MNLDFTLNRALDFAFPIFLVLVSLGFALVEPSFLGLENIFGMLHAMAPIAVISTGMALIVIMGKLDISLGSILSRSSM